MKKLMLLLVLSLIVFGQAMTDEVYEKSSNSVIVASKVQPDNLRMDLQSQKLSLSRKVKQSTSRCPAEVLFLGSRTKQVFSKYIAIETQIAGVSITETKSPLVKADLDEEAGRINWITAIIIVCIAFLVYLINRKKHDK
ncbi:hypothetical protein [Planococcus versutus]|uniref:Type VII secretion protein EssA n=1 Tax=Planococcus versutus TaxID=1302659 RepID=A0A1B1S4X7_9BACL|nr:hypothetical protein [Planococcus versutus]ANU28257.1 hypothetical protein I858_014795 [Planococcus versutus]